MIQFKIVTPEGIIYEDEIEKITIPTGAGEITVLPKHIPLITTLVPGQLTIWKKNDDMNQEYKVVMAVSGGVVEVRPQNTVYIMADTAERAEQIDIDRAQIAHKRALELLKEQKDVVDVDFAYIQAKMEKEMTRMRVGKKYKKLKPMD